MWQGWGLVLCPKMKDCWTFCIHFCNIVMYDQFGDEVESLVYLAFAALMHTDPAKGCCHTDCFYLGSSWFSVCWNWRHVLNSSSLRKPLLCLRCEFSMVYIRTVSTVCASHIQSFSTCPFMLYLHLLSNNFLKKAKLFSAMFYFQLCFYWRHVPSGAMNDFSSLPLNPLAVGPKRQFFYG